MTYLLKRKKFTFRSIANNIKGFVRTVSGKPPLKLWACVDTNSVIIYRITGKGVGDYDENTGKYKIPVKCSGINLFDKDRANIGRWVIQANTLKLCPRTPEYKHEGVFIWIEIKPNTTYTITKIGQGAVYALCSSMPKDNEYVNRREKGEKNIFTIRSGATDKYLLVAVASSANNIYVVDDVIKSLQIIEGSYTALTVPEYEPYREPVLTNVILDEPLTEGQTINYKNNLPVIPTIKGTTILSVDTEIQPLNMEVIYYSTSKE